MFGPARVLSESDVVADESWRVSILDRAAFTRPIPREIRVENTSSRSVSLLELPSRRRAPSAGDGGASGAVANATGCER